MTRERMEELLDMANVRHLKASELRELAMQIEQYEKKENSFIDYCKNHIEEKIYGFVGQSFYGCDLSHELTMEENCNGTLTFDRKEAIVQLNEWWYDCADYWTYEKDNFGEHCHNPFDEPEAYMVCMVIEGCASLLGQTEALQEVWNDEFELTKELADKIVEQVYKINEIW